ncbi:MFS transporter [Thiohalocapsa halophila]|uniref:MFS transporter n=1 Tax=Thiohalocapsa halophila TaxID=69359 RepID=UPI0019050313|nr:MFS transporter [Thiohalocapsa halophila]
MNELVVNLSGALLSGMFSVLATLIPYFLEKRKSKEVRVREIAEGNYSPYPGWSLLLATSVPALIYFLIAAYGALSGVFVILLIGEQIPEFWGLMKSFDQAKSPEVLWYGTLFDIAMVSSVMFVVIVLSSRFLAHRSGRKDKLFVFLSVLAVWSVNLSEYVLFLPVTSENLQSLFIVNSFATFVVFFLAGALGLRWAHRTRDDFIVSVVFAKLLGNDRAAFRDLALDLVGSEKYAARLAQNGSNE